MQPPTTSHFVRFHIDASLDALALLSESERAELSFDLAASLTELAHASVETSLPPSTSLRMLSAASELRAASLSERNRRESQELRQEL
ncbi:MULTISPECIES: hypothetical protein [unclassified Dinoroseobacter]|uniref:hypothetical protein n=1 Tax=unclassified Dinoroseobacter TaxID=2620028 RepID=UPI003C7C383A